MEEALGTRAGVLSRGFKREVICAQEDESKEGLLKGRKKRKRRWRSRKACAQRMDEHGRSWSCLACMQGKHVTRLGPAALDHAWLGASMKRANSSAITTRERVDLFVRRFHHIQKSSCILIISSLYFFFCCVEEIRSSCFVRPEKCQAAATRPRKPHANSQISKRKREQSSNFFPFSSSLSFFREHPPRRPV